MPGSMPDELQPQRADTNRSSLIRLTCILGAVFILLAVFGWILTPDAATMDNKPAINTQKSVLQISEYMSSNNAYPDADGNFCDWLELHNTSAEPFPLRDYALTDGSNTWMLPDMTLEADGYLVIFCDGEGKKDLHANLRLKAAGGEDISIRSPGGKIVESIHTMTLETNTSAIRGDGVFTATTRYTPGYANTDEGWEAFQSSRTVTQNALLISEVMADNTVVMPDADGQYPDYIEVVNRSAESIDLFHYGLSNDRSEPLKYQFPDITLAPGQTVLVYASGKGHSADPNELHAGFKISKSSDTVFLSTPAGLIMDSVEINGLLSNMALVRQTDGSWQKSHTPSPGQPNTDEGVDACCKALEEKRTSPIRISEAMTRNSRFGAALAGKYYDWIELHNISDEAVSLSGYHLTNDPSQPELFALPDVSIPAGGYLVVYATGATVVQGSSYIQANFKLNAEESAVALFSPDGSMADGLALNGLPMNASRGRNADGGIVYYTIPTPGAANSGSSNRYLSATPVAMTAAGVYNDISSLEVALSGAGAIYYTLDGSEPTTSSPRYTGPLSLTSTTAVRAIAVAEGAAPSDCLTASYILNENHTMEVVSLVSDPVGMFDPVKGIYTDANYNGRGMKYERAGHIEFFPKSGTGFSQGCGIRIFGGASRMYEKKSLSIKFRDMYGDGKLDYKVFDNRDFTVYNSLILRSSGQERLRSMFKDAMTTSLVGDMGLLEVQAYRPVVLYINGEYFGVHNIREKIDEQFIATHQNVSPDSVELLQGNGVGNDDYQALISYVKANAGNINDDAVYQHILDQIDPVSLCDYYIAEIYCYNNDAGNIRFYRSSQMDNKWRWILYDTDQGFEGSAANDRIWYNIKPGGTGTNNYFSTTLIYTLLHNDDFRALFLERLGYNMKNVWNTERVLERIDQFHELYKPEALRNFQRWRDDQTDEQRMSSWEGWVEKFRNFAKNRQAMIKKELTTSPNVVAIFGLSAAEADQYFE